MPKHINDDAYAASTTINKYLAVVEDTAVANGCKAPTAAAVKILGITQDDVVGASGAPRNVRVRAIGISIATASAAINRGADVGVAGTSGKLRTATTGDVIVGRAQTAAAADGDYFEVRLFNGDAVSA